MERWAKGCFTIVLMVAGCAHAPYRGASQVAAWARRQGGVVTDARQLRLDAAVAALARGCSGRELRPHVLDSDHACAYSWPNGHLFVTRGLVDRLTDDELTAAVAHELGHLLQDGHVATLVSLRGCRQGTEVEAAADEWGCQLLQSRGRSPTAMISMLRKVRAATEDPACGRALQLRIDLLVNHFPSRAAE